VRRGCCRLRAKLKQRYFYAVFVILSAALAVVTWRQYAAIDWTETFGFITGALCVWLTVEENIWNWPIGIANNVFFIFLFVGQRLWADTGLQVVYIVLGFLGWYWWLHGGKDKKELHVSKTPRVEWAILAVIGIIATYGMTVYLKGVDDGAPFLDAITTVLSLIAQYMITKKYLENWWVWIVVDLLSIYMYIVKHLYLTAVLYAIFTYMCVLGLTAWHRSFKNDLERTFV